MCNCGSKRNVMTNGNPAAFEQALPAGKRWADIRFRYTGKTALTVRGIVTGKQYRFTQTGSELLIDFRDVPGILKVPVLKRV